MEAYAGQVTQWLDEISGYLWLGGGAILTLIVSVLPRVGNKWTTAILTLATLTATAIMTVRMPDARDASIFFGMLDAGAYAKVFHFVFILSAAMTVLLSFRYLDTEEIQHSEYNVLILFSLFGMMLMAGATDLIVMFIGLEIMSLTIYTLVGFRRSDRRSNEAALKYFILGGAASAVFLYGSSLLYGAAGSTQLSYVLGIAQSQGSQVSLTFAMGAALVLIGFLFKIASVPFHMWMPDVYEGAPVPVTGFMTTGIKAASFAALIRVVMSLGVGRGLSETVVANIHNVLWVSAVLTMVVGNLIALTQTNLKRMLAYSSIAHTGYLLVGIVAGYQGEDGYSPVIIYLLAYTIMNLGAFGVLTVLASRTKKGADQGLNLHDLSGLAKQHPWLAFAMAVFMFSMAGMPATAGFIGKYMLFYSAVQAGEILLVVLSVLCSAISVYYYLRVLVYMYMREPFSARGVREPMSLAAITCIAAAVTLTFQVGLMPGGLIEFLKMSLAGI